MKAIFVHMAPTDRRRPRMHRMGGAGQSAWATVVMQHL